MHKSIELDEQSLIIKRGIGDREGEGNSLSRLGSCYAVLGNVHKAIEYYEQALSIAREINHRRGEEGRLSNLGNRYYELDDMRKSVEFHEQALIISREIGDRDGEASTLGNLGFAFLNINDYEKAMGNFIQSIEIADEILYPIVQCEERWGLAQTYLLQNDLVNAHATIEAALQYDVPSNNHNATALHGIIALRQGERETAQEASTKSIAQADEILAKTPDYYDALDAKGLALCGSAVSREWGIGNRE